MSQLKGISAMLLPKYIKLQGEQAEAVIHTAEAACLKGNFSIFQPGSYFPVFFVSLWLTGTMKRATMRVASCRALTQYWILLSPHS